MIKNVKNSKIYIGKTSKEIEKRLKSHFINADKKINRRLYDSINFHGKEFFSIEKIDEAISNEEANEKEIYWISFYKSNSKEFGYNMTIGGDGGATFFGKGTMKGKTCYDKWLKEHGKEIADLKRIEINSKISKSNKNKKLGDENPAKRQEVKNKISNTLKERKSSSWHKIRPNWQINGDKPPIHYIGHSNKSKEKMSNARKGKSYDDFYGIEKSKIIKEKRKNSWSGKNNPLYKELIFTQELLQEIKTSKELKNVAKKYGFSYPTLLSKFRKKFNTTIKQYRNEKN